MTTTDDAVRERYEAIAEWAFHSGDEIMAAVGRSRDADGNWSEEDLAWLWTECERILIAKGLIS